jgi:selenocysteine-specific translation elongation factor
LFVAVLSDKPELRERFCSSFGKGTGKDDIGFYSSEGSGQTITLMDPIAYPEKIQPLLYTLSMADAAVLLVDTLTPKIGEIIVALDSLGLDRGVVVSSSQIPLKGTVLDKYEKVADMEAAKAKVLAFAPAAGGETALALAERTAAVKSVGNVAYSSVKSGKIRKQDKLFLLPEGKDIEVRSIHVNGNEVEEAGAGTRIEMAFKGDLFERGIIVPLRNEHQVENVVNGKFVKSPFFKDELKGRIHAYTNMQYVEGAVTDNDLTLLAPLAFEKGESILVVDASNQKLRIAGVFKSKW